MSAARRWVASDLALLVVLLGMAVAALLVPGVPEPIEWALGVPFLVLVPGYALISALLPWSDDREPTGEGDGHRGGDLLRRVTLALPLSVIAVGAVGVLLSATVGIRLVPAVVGIAAVTVLGVVVALVRRVTHPPAARAAPLRESSTSMLRLGGTPVQTAVMILALVALTTAVAFAATAPTDQDPYTEFYVLSENETGDLVADEYPATFVAGEGHTLYFGVENHEHRRVTYDVVVRSQAVGPDGNATATERVDSFNVGVDAGERAIVERTVAPTETGEPRRLQFLLFEDGVPSDPGADGADAALHVWVDVTADDSTSSTGPTEGGSIGAGSAGSESTRTGPT